MKKTRLIGILVLILFMGNSCKTYKNLEKVKPKTDSKLISEEIQKLKPWDNIKVFEKSGSIRILEYVVIEEGVLRGFETKRTKGDLISIRVEDIVQVQVKKVDTQKTVLKSASVVGLAMVAGLLVLFLILGSQAS